MFAKNHRLLQLAKTKSPKPLKKTRTRIRIVAGVDAAVVVDEVVGVAVKVVPKVAAMLVATPDAMVLANHAASGQSRLVGQLAISMTSLKWTSSTKMQSWKTSRTNLTMSSNDHLDDLAAVVLIVAIALSGQNGEIVGNGPNGQRNAASEASGQNVPNDHLALNVASVETDRNVRIGANGLTGANGRLVLNAENEANAVIDRIAGSVVNDRNVLDATPARIEKVASQENRGNHVKADVLSVNERKAATLMWMIVVPWILVRLLRNSVISRHGKKRLDVCRCELQRKTMLDARKTVTRLATTDLRVAVSRL